METPDLERFMINRDISAEGTTCCIQLACDPSVDQQTARWASLAYFRYGGAPSRNGVSSNTPLGVTSPMSPVGARPGNLSQFFSPIAARPGSNFVASTPMPQLPQPNLNSTQIVTNTPNQPNSLSNISNSARYRGLAKYLSRLLRPIWNSPIVSKTTGAEKQVTLTSRLSYDNLGRILNALLNLKVWMEQNAIGTSPVSTSTVDINSFENSQFSSLYRLLTRTQEVIALWQLLSDNQLHVITTALEVTEKEQLQQIPVRYAFKYIFEIQCMTMRASLNLKIELFGEK